MSALWDGIMKYKKCPECGCEDLQVMITGCKSILYIKGIRVIKEEPSYGVAEKLVQCNGEGCNFEEQI